ncbi:MAG: toll/interleukin-1 receptor domain-containing protein [Kiloniellaceae bacterium]
MSDPKAFISYSWTTPDHEARVLQLATDLRESGVDVILDKWDLKEGHDAHAFMESMVTDPHIRKVIMICDRAYKEKADGRKKGVGTEAQIISKELYDKKSQDKFVAVVTECDHEGEPFLPIYYAARIYIDLSDPATHGTEFERLVRWIFDKPLYQKPPIGQKPLYLSSDQRVALGTSASFRRTAEALRNGRPYAHSALSDYLEILVAELGKFRVDPSADPFDDAVVQNIEAFLPYRNEVIELFLDVAKDVHTEVYWRPVHRFFESLIPYMHRPEGVSSWHTHQFDNFKFIIYELFLYAIAALIRYEQFEFANHLLTSDYYVAQNTDHGSDVMIPYTVFSNEIGSLENRNHRLKLGRASLRADLLRQRATGVGINFRELVQADFILFIRSELHFSNSLSRWWPVTLIYVERHSQAPLEVFARSKSRTYFEQAKLLLGIASKDDLAGLLDAYSSQQRDLPRWGFHRFNPRVLLGYDQLASAS